MYLLENYRHFITMISYFSPEWCRDYVTGEYPPDEMIVDDIIDKFNINLIGALQETKEFIENEKFSALGIMQETRYFKNPADVKPWFIGILKMIEEKALKKGIDIPVDLRGLWKKVEAMEDRDDNYNS